MADNLDTESDCYDIVVIGGGINGCGLARDASGRGLRVLLCEKGDLSEGTSSRSGKYIHGGLRYLEYYEFRLVREALIEREVILNIAPHLAWPMRLVLPHSPEQRPRWLIRLGLFLYDHLGGRKRLPATRALNLSQVPEGRALRGEFEKAFEYADVWVDDSRLVILNAVDAARKGATVLTRTRFESAFRRDLFWYVTLCNECTGETKEVRARALINAAGPWVEKVLSRVQEVQSSRSVRLVKGSHIIMRRWWDGGHGYVLQNTDKRLIFVNPYFDDLALVGTTDIPVEGKAEDVVASDFEIDYLLGILNRYFKVTLQPSDVITSYSGVRPLYDDDKDKNASAVTRDYTFDIDCENGSAPLLSVFGGKLTTYRKLSEHALEKLSDFFPNMGPRWTRDAHLPGGNIELAQFDQWLSQFRDDHDWLPSNLAKHYARTYGTDAYRLLAQAKEVADLGNHFGADLYECEVRWCQQHEWAISADDILYRRSKHGLFLSPDEKRRLSQWMQSARQRAEHG